MRKVNPSELILVALALGLAGCGSGSDKDAFLNSRPNQVVLKVDGIV